MKQNNIDVCAIQEIHVDYNEKSASNEYTWFLSGQTNHIYAGVGFIISNKMKQYP